VDVSEVVANPAGMVECPACGTSFRSHLTKGSCPVCGWGGPAPSRLSWFKQTDRVDLMVVATVTVVNLLLLAGLVIVLSRA
jgi:ribosomal protein L37E